MSQVTDPEPDALAAAEFIVMNRVTRVDAPGFSKIVSLFMIIATPAAATARPMRKIAIRKNSETTTRNNGTKIKIARTTTPTISTGSVIILEPRNECLAVCRPRVQDAPARAERAIAKRNRRDLDSG